MICIFMYSLSCVVVNIYRLSWRVFVYILVAFNLPKTPGYMRSKLPVRNDAFKVVDNAWSWSPPTLANLRRRRLLQPPCTLRDILSLQPLLSRSSTLASTRTRTYSQRRRQPGSPSTAPTHYSSYASEVSTFEFALINTISGGRRTKPPVPAKQGRRLG